MRAVFLDLATFSPRVTLTSIQQQVECLDCYGLTPPEQVIERCRHAQIIISNKVALSGEVLAALPELKLVCIAATGTNNVDLAAAEKLDIPVTNVTNYANQSVSQYVFAQLLGYYSNIQHHNQNVREGQWQKHHSFCVHGMGMDELAGKTLSIIGYGNLGQAVANIARALGMHVLVAERAESEHIRADRVAFEEAMARADIVSLHCPQTPATENIINENTLALMKPGGVLVNTARGGLVDNLALLAALRDGKLASAILDVLEQEPPPADHPLLTAGLDNLIITAHMAWASHQVQQRLLDQLADNIRGFALGKLPNRVTNT